MEGIREQDEGHAADVTEEQGERESIPFENDDAAKEDEDAKWVTRPPNRPPPSLFRMYTTAIPSTLVQCKHARSCSRMYYCSSFALHTFTRITNLCLAKLSTLFQPFHFV